MKIFQKFFSRHFTVSLAAGTVRLMVRLMRANSQQLIMSRIALLAVLAHPAPNIEKDRISTSGLADAFVLT